MEKEIKDQGPSGLSIAALITGIFGLSVVPIILGAIDIVKINKGESPRQGMPLDIAGIVLGVIGIIASIIVIIAAALIIYNLGVSGFDLQDIFRFF